MSEHLNEYKNITASSYLDHDGKPNPKDQIEILKVIGMAAGFVSGTTAIWAKMAEVSTYSIHWAYLVIFAVGGAGLSIWSSCLAFRAVRGQKKLGETKFPQMVAYALVLVPFTWPAAIIAGMLFN